MILNLILKNFIVHKNLIYLKIILPMVLLSSYLIFRIDPMELYVTQGFMVIAVASSIYCFMEDKYNMLTCSLPVNRTAIVISRYLTSILIGFSGIIIWLLGAYFSDLIYTNIATDFQQVKSFKVLVIALFFLAVHLSIFLPVVLSLGRFWGIVTFFAAMGISIAAIIPTFIPGIGTFNPNFEIEEVFMYVLFGIGIVLLFCASLLLSIFFYNRKNL